VLRVSASLLASSIVAGVLAACSIMPTTGPEIGEIHRSEQTSDPDRLPYALVTVNPQVVDRLATWAPRIANTFTDQRPPRQIKFGIGDTVSVSIFEAAAGGLFIPIEAGVRPGNFVTLPKPERRSVRQYHRTVCRRGQGGKQDAGGGAAGDRQLVEEPRHRAAGRGGPGRSAHLAD
jgi:hypothetical protein